MNFVQELEPGALLPDCILTNQSGQAFHLGEFKGRALAFTFFFSRCPLPTFCPLMNRNLAAVQRALQSEVTRTNWQLLSISFDPEFDTPAHLCRLRQNLPKRPTALEFRHLRPGGNPQAWRRVWTDVLERKRDHQPQPAHRGRGCLGSCAEGLHGQRMATCRSGCGNEKGDGGKALKRAYSEI